MKDLALIIFHILAATEKSDVPVDCVPLSPRVRRSGSSGLFYAGSRPRASNLTAMDRFLFGFKLVWSHASSQQMRITKTNRKSPIG